jgi:hypothetical protein
MRDAISLLDQLIAEPQDVLTLELAHAILGTASEHAVRELTYALLEGNIAQGLEIINAAIDQGADARQFANQMVQHLRRVMVVQTGGMDLIAVEIMPEELEIVAEQAQQIPRRALLVALEHFQQAVAEASTGWQPQLPLELALVSSVETLYTTPAPSPPIQQEPAPAAAPAPSAPAKTEESAAFEAGEITTGEVHARWREVLSVCRQIDPTGVVQALLKSGSVFDIDGNTVIYQMPGDVLCAKIMDEASRDVIERALQHVYKLPLQIRCRVQQKTESEKTDQVESLIANDSVVSFAVNELGGQVKHIETDEE